MTEYLQTVFNLETAIAIAEVRHADQLDKNGVPYIFHLRSVMGQLQGEKTKEAGVLHDILEDTDTTAEELLQMGVPKEVVEAVQLVTHPKRKVKMTEAHYYQDIRTIAFSGSQIAVDVKWADLTHNSDLTRLQEVTEWDIKRWQKYQQAKLILRPLVSQYLLDAELEIATL